MGAVDQAQASVAWLRPDDYGPLDELLYEGVASYAVPIDEDRRLGWIAAACDHHLRANAVFQRLAERQRFRPEVLLDRGDPALVPLLSSGLFRRRELATDPASQLKRCKSSGTRGTPSVVPRDPRTLERFVGTVVHGLREFIGHVDSRAAFVLGPRAYDAEETWFSYVLTLVELLYDTYFFVRDDALQHQSLYAALADLPPDVEPALVAPPALLLDFLEWMDERGHRLELGRHDGLVVTAGGWKRREKEAVSPERLADLTVRVLGIDRARVRDSYNMVELNTVLFECELGRKHVPPWLLVLARRPSDMSPARPGEEGVLSFLDPTALSYPCFVLSDDVGVVERTSCGCGRHGDTVAISRRLASLEQRGCALKLERYGRSETA